MEAQPGGGGGTTLKPSRPASFVLVDQYDTPNPDGTKVAGFSPSGGYVCSPGVDPSSYLDSFDQGTYDSCKLTWTMEPRDRSSPARVFDSTFDPLQSMLGGGNNFIVETQFCVSTLDNDQKGGAYRSINVYKAEIGKMTGDSKNCDPSDPGYEPPAPTPTPTPSPTPTPDPGNCPPGFSDPQDPAYLKPSDKYLDFLKGFEGYVPFLYNDNTPKKFQTNPISNPAKQKGDCTIGMGHKVHDDLCLSSSDYQKGISPGNTDPELGQKAVSEKPFRDKLGTGNASDVDKFLNDKIREDLKDKTDAVKKTFKGVPITQSQFDAMTDLAFNAGRGAMAQSKAAKALSAGNPAAAAKAISGYGRESAIKKKQGGLLKRRPANGDMVNNDCDGYDQRP